MTSQDHQSAYKHPVGTALGSSIIAVGLYTTTFEAVIRLMRIAVAEYIEQDDNDRQHQLVQFQKASAAARAIDFCGRYLLQAATATRGDIEFLHKVRCYRNQLVHESIDRLFCAPTLADVSRDIRRMINIAHAIEAWQRSRWPPAPNGMTHMAISFSGLLESCFRVATELADDLLSDRHDC
jgi:hypothetical protein